MGLAIMALETNTAPLAHDHSTTDGDGIWPTNQLAQANTHQSPDTNVSVNSLHHTIGTSPTQAAAGNHAHDYNGPSIFNQPLTICSSTNRPPDPIVGQMIWETDTNCVRAWASFPNNTLSPGTVYTYNFNTANANTSLDSTIFTPTVVTGSSPADGAMGAPTSGNCAWYRGANVTCRIIERGIVTTFNTFATDDQQMQVTTGATQLQNPYSTNPSPTNDFYLRCSTNLQSYVRYSLSNVGVSISYTTGGTSSEQILGSVNCTTDAEATTWIFKIVGNTYLVYSNGQLVLSAVDNNNVVNVGSSYRGWALGMLASAGATQQMVPNSLTTFTVSDLPFYSSPLVWQLLPVANKPHILAEARFEQQVYPLNPTILAFDTLLGNWIPDPFMDTEVSQTDITIQEAGVYQVNASICWDPAYASFDNAGVGFTLNGQDIGRLAKDFMRGNGYAPGFAQTQSCSFTYSFAEGDVLRVTAQHNAEVVCWLFWNDIPNLTQVCWVELSFVGPPSSA
jgi:hypothetical protein